MRLVAASAARRRRVMGFSSGIRWRDSSGKLAADKWAPAVGSPQQECRMDRLTSMAVFVRVAEKGSFAAAAEGLAMSSTMVANHVRALEARIGARLLDRTTRRHALTEIGAAYLELCRDALAGVHAADHVAEALRAVPQGTLRVTAPVTWGTHRLVPVVGEYLAMYPDVKIDLSLNDRVVDLAEEGFDCGIRSGDLADERLIARPLRRAHMLVA